MKAVIDQENCIGCGLCAELCPGVFCMEDSVAAVCGKVTDENMSEVQEAVEGCPVSVISLED